MDNVAGVKIPKFEQLLEGVDSKMSLTGLSKGGKAIQVRARPCMLWDRLRCQAGRSDYSPIAL